MFIGHKILCRVLAAAITLVLLPVMLYVATGYAEEGSPVPVAVPEKAVQPAKSPASPTLPVKSALDETHASIEQNLLWQVEWLDDFFGSARSDKLRETAYHLQWKNSLRLVDGGRLKPGTTVRANIRLSRINERLRLYIAGESLTDTNAISLPEDPGNPGFDRTSTPQTAKMVNTELRYVLKQTPEIESFLGVGVRLVLPPEAFVRARFHYNLQLSNIDLFRFGETLFLKNRDGFGATTELSLERLLNPKRLLRWANIATVSEVIKGLEWGSELSLIQQLSSKSATSLTGGVYGNINSPAIATTFRILSSYRRNFLRDWLYYEIMPEVFWPRDSLGRYLATYAVTLNLEVMFDGTTVKRR